MLCPHQACFAGFEHLLLALKSGLEGGMPDVPAEVALQLQRQEFITSKIIDQIPGTLYVCGLNGRLELLDWVGKT